MKDDIPRLFPVWFLHTDLLQLMGLKKQGLRNGRSRNDLVLMYKRPIWWTKLLMWSTLLRYLNLQINLPGKGRLFFTEVGAKTRFWLRKAVFSD